MEVAECDRRSRKNKKSAEEKGKPNMSATLLGGQETKRLRRCEKTGEDRYPMADSEPKPERSKLSRKRRTTRAERKAKLKQKILKKAGPKYWALVDLVKQRDKCYEGPEKSRAYRTGALLLKEARGLALYGRARDLESHCEYALEEIADTPLCKSEHLKNDPELVKQYRIQTENCANTALEVYNEQNPGAEFELVEAISSNAFAHYGCDGSYHANFTAKPKNSDASGGGDASPKLFFAELTHQTRSGEAPDPFICRCSIVDLDNKSRVRTSCGYCRPSDIMYHPVGQYKCGLFCYRVPAFTVAKPRFLGGVQPTNRSG